MRLPALLKGFAILVPLGLLACSSGDDGGGGSYPSNSLWVHIDTQSLQSVVSATSVDLSGTLYCGNACPPGDVGFGYCPSVNLNLPAPAIDVAWSNRKNGATGVAAHGIAGSCSCLFSYCFTSYSHRWSAYGGIPLEMGDNSIEVTVSDASANSAKDSVAITRIPVPSLRHPNGIAVDAAHDEVLVASSGNSSIVVYARTDSERATPKRVISGASTGLSSPSAVAVDALHDEILVVGGGNSRVSVYRRTADGDVAPLRSITGLNSPVGIAVDAVNNEIFVVTGDSFVAVYPRTADGAAVPVRSLAGPSGAGRIALDTVNGEMFVTGSDSSVVVYPLNASGSAAPLRIISGASTGLNWPRDIAVDAVNDEVSVVNSNSSITTYPRTAAGDAAPIRTLAGATTKLYTGQSMGIAVDATHDEVFATSGWDADYWDGVSSYFTAYITVYPRTAGGDVAPIRTIDGAYP